MKNIAYALIALTILMILSGCSSISEYDEGYGQGYEDGRSIGYSVGFDDGYIEGYNEAEEYYEFRPSRDYDDNSGLELWEVEEEASLYAYEKSGLSAYEAAQIVGIYLDGGNDFTHEEYLQALESLMYFYYYFE
jgi:hypothetical protein